MSFHRENILWQSADGTWSHGFYECHESYGGRGDDDDEDSFDPEWDVEYNYGALEQASCGHPSEDAAFQSWRGANPGGSTVLPSDSDSAAEVAQLDDLAAELEDAQREQEASGRRSIFLNPQDRPFHDVRGVSKSDDPVSLRRRLDTADKVRGDGCRAALTANAGLQQRPDAGARRARCETGRSAEPPRRRCSPGHRSTT